MKLNQPKKIVLGILTVWPIIYMFLFMVFMFGMAFLNMFDGKGEREAPILFLVLIGLHFFTCLYTMVLIGFYVYYLFKTERVPKDKKALWAVVIFLGNVFAMPIFWFLYIWQQPNINSS